MTISERRRAMLDGIRQEIAQKQAQLDKIRQVLAEHRSAVLRGVESPLVEGRLDAESRPLLPETVLDHLDRTEVSLVESIGVLERQAAKIVMLLGETTTVNPRPL